MIYQRKKDCPIQSFNGGKVANVIYTKLLYSNFNKDTGISTVIIRNKYGTFKGRSKLHDSDKGYASNYAGCRFAEMKANIKCLKKQKADKQLRLTELLYFKNMLEGVAGYNSESIEARKLRKRIYILKTEIQQLDDVIDKAATALKQEIQERDKALNFLKKYKSKSD